MVEAVPNWDINEITLAVDDTTVILLEKPNTRKFRNGTVQKAQVCLTLKDAKKLFKSLSFAIEYYENL